MFLKWLSQMPLYCHKLLHIPYLCTLLTTEFPTHWKFHTPHHWYNNYRHHFIFIPDDSPPHCLLFSTATVHRLAFPPKIHFPHLFEWVNGPPLYSQSSKSVSQSVNPRPRLLLRRPVSSPLLRGLLRPRQSYECDQEINAAIIVALFFYQKPLAIHKSIPALSCNCPKLSTIRVNFINDIKHSLNRISTKKNSITWIYHLSCMDYQIIFSTAKNALWMLLRWQIACPLGLAIQNRFHRERVSNPIRIFPIYSPTRKRMEIIIIQSKKITHKKWEFSLGIFWFLYFMCAFSITCISWFYSSVCQHLFLAVSFLCKNCIIYILFNRN